MSNGYSEQATVEEGLPFVEDVSLSAYLEVFFLTLLFVAGVPTNLLVLYRLCTRRRRAANDARHAWFELLLHLNISDLMILCVYVIVQVVHRLTFHWYAGDFMCKFMMFLCALCFYLSSNIIVCISIDKVLTYKGTNPAVRQQRIRAMLAIAWTMAILCSAPQFYIFHVQTIHIETLGTTVQCIDRWFLERVNATTDTQAESGFSDFQAYYYLVHMLTVFWIPALMIAVCYGLLMLRVCALSARLAMKYGSQNANDTIQGDVKADHRERRRIGARTRKRVFRITAVLVITYYITWLPYNVVTLLASFEVTESAAFPLRFLYHVIVVNSVLNAYVYGVCGLLHICPSRAPASSYSGADIGVVSTLL